jgi:hypothetical protein
MKPEDKERFAQLMIGVAELYGKKLSNQLLNIYWAALTAYSLEEVNAALNRHALSPDVGQFMPKPADIVRCLEGSSSTQALQAWTKVINAIKQVGAYSSVIFDDPLIHAVIYDMGGWIRLCQSKEDEAGFRSREFEKRYSAYVLQPPTAYPAHLPGVIEQQNALAGFAKEPPMLIGDKSSAEPGISIRHHAITDDTSFTST